MFQPPRALESFGTGDDAADDQQSLEGDDGSPWDPTPEDEEQMRLEQETEVNLDIHRRAYGMEEASFEEEDEWNASWLWAGWLNDFYYVSSGVPSRKDRGAYLLKNTAPVDRSYHLIKCHPLPPAGSWTVSLPE